MTTRANSFCGLHLANTPKFWMKMPQVDRVIFDELKIFYSWIVALMIAMVNDFTVLKFATKFVFHHKPMQTDGNTLPVSPDVYNRIATTIQMDRNIVNRRKCGAAFYFVLNVLRKAISYGTQGAQEFSKMLLPPVTHAQGLSCNYFSALTERAFGSHAKIVMASTHVVKWGG